MLWLRLTGLLALGGGVGLFLWGDSARSDLPDRPLFVCVDMTSDADSQELARQLEGAGWGNLLELACGGPAMSSFDARRGVVLPVGQVHHRVRAELGGFGEFVGETEIEEAKQQVARVRDWLSEPSLPVSDASGTARPSVRFADLLYLSGHGVAEGEVRSSVNLPVSPPGSGWQPLTGVIFDVDDLRRRRYWANGRTRWVILAACSILDSEGLDPWIGTLEQASGLRGVLGYAGPAPAAELAAEVNERFVEACLEGRSMVEAWALAHESHPRYRSSWRAVLREDATDDSLLDWAMSGELPVGEDNVVTLHVLAGEGTPLRLAQRSLRSPHRGTAAEPVRKHRPSRVDE